MLHRRWASLDERRLREELVDAKRVLEEIVGAPVTDAACPFGSYNRRVLRRLRKCGYRHVYTSDRGMTGRADWLQARNTVRRVDEADLLARISPASRRASGSSAVCGAAPRGGTDGCPREPHHRCRRPRVGEFLNENLNKRLSADHWARAINVPWTVDRPNSGFILLNDDVIVGAHLAFYSERVIEGRRERFCNLGAWCVLPEYRLHSLRLLKAAARPGGLPLHRPVAHRERRRGQREAAAFAYWTRPRVPAPNLPWPSVPGRVAISSDPAADRAHPPGGELRLYRDHAATGAASTWYSGRATSAATSSSARTGVRSCACSPRSCM